jgi:hypothetical protein
LLPFGPTGKSSQLEQAILFSQQCITINFELIIIIILVL